MNNEKVREAIVALDGIWPTFLEKKTEVNGITTYPVPNKNRRLLLCLETYSSPWGDFVEGEYYGGGSGASKDKFEVICTKEEFESLIGNEVNEVNEVKQIEITLAGKAGSGKSVISTLLIKALGAKIIGGGVNSSSHTTTIECVLHGKKTIVSLVESQS